MRRVFLAAFASIAFTIAATLPVSAIGQTLVTLTCDDGTSTSLIADADTLLALTTAVQGMVDYPAGLTCSLTQQIVRVPFGGGVALATSDSRFIVGGGRWLVPCGNFGGGGGGGAAAVAAAAVPDMVFVNIAVNVHDKGGGVFVGTLNETIPANQSCIGVGPVGESHFTSKPTCVAIISTDGPPGLGQGFPRHAVVTTVVTQVSGLPFPSGGVGSPPLAAGSTVHFSFIDNGNPGQQLAKDKLQGPPAFDDSNCPTFGSAPTFDLQNGNISIHP